jgi:hypothetical protein
VTGTLGLFSLVDLVQLLASASRTGRLGIRHPLGSAKVYFERGRVVHVEFGDREGADAAFALFADERGTFEFVSGLPAPRRSVEQSTESLVLDALRLLDEARRDEAPIVPGLDRSAVPYTPEDAVAGVSLGATERQVVAAIDGQLTIGRLAIELGLPLDEVQRVVARLMHVGLVALRAKRPRTAQLVVRLTESRGPVGAVGVDEGIIANWSSTLERSVERVAVRRGDGLAFKVPVVGVTGGGPYLHVDRDTLLRFDLHADDTVLVRPHAP